MNTRYHLLKWASILSGNGIFSAYQEALDWDKLSPTEIKNKQEQCLLKLLKHAYLRVPYYREILTENGLFNEDDSLDIKRFKQLPFLTKDILRVEFDRLLSDDWKARRGKPNTSGGSTGEPVQFIQDREHRRWSVYANKLYYNHVLGKFPGERELLLWGSDRDIFRGSIGFKAKLVNLMYNRRFLNAYRMSPESMRNYIHQINTFKPVSIWAYVESLELLARFADEEGLEIIPPKMVISTAGTLFPPTRELIERGFGAPLYNQYGSREVGPIACQCQAKDHLHLFPWTHFVEVLDENGEQTPPGQEGEVSITNLVNYAMPLIRYKIGDRAIQPNRPCNCGRKGHIFGKVTGRISEHLLALDGSKVYGGFFRLLYYHRPWVSKYQITQTKQDEVVNKIVVNNPPPKKDLNEIEINQKKVLGKNMKIIFKEVQEILPSDSGKFLFVINLIEKDITKHD